MLFENGHETTEIGLVGLGVMYIELTDYIGWHDLHPFEAVSSTTLTAMTNGAKVMSEELGLSRAGGSLSLSR